MVKLMGQNEMGWTERVGSHSLEHLYRTNASSALRLAYLLTGDQQAAQDLVQDAFVRLAGRFRHLRDPDSMASYLRVTVANLARNYHRRKRIEGRFLSSQASRGAEQVVEPPDLGDRDYLWRLLEALPYRQRCALVLRYYESLSEEETAEVMQCSTHAVNSLVGRGMRTLRSQLTKRPES